MSMGGQGTKRRINIAENFNRLSRAQERYRRQTTDRRTMTYSEREREFTFAKMELKNRSFQYGKVALAVRTTIPSVTVCAQSGRHLHRHLHVSCADRSFSAAAGLPVCISCSVNPQQKSVSAEQDQSFSGNSSNNFLAL